MEARLVHWVEKIADRVVEERNPPFVIGAGITTSGPAHLGTVCEFLYPWALSQELKKRGFNTLFIFVGDIMDAFDSIPVQLKEYSNQLRDHLGKPLCDVPDVYGCHRSYGEHFLDEIRDLMEIFGVDCDVIEPANKLYDEKWYLDYALFFMENLEKVRKLLEEVSGRVFPKDWKDIILPVCPSCGKIATTRILDLDPNTGKIVFSCDKDVDYVKGCGFKGDMKLSNGRWKLTWRLDWPSRMDFLGVDVEGAGVDHHTKGGSWDTAVAIFNQLFKKRPPIGFKYGFVLYRGRKMSKSKGVGALSRILRLLPPESLKYFLFKHEVDENKNFDESPEFLLRLIEEFEFIGDLYEDVGENVGRRWHRHVIAYRLACGGVKPWRVKFVDVLVFYQIHNDWRIVEEKLDDAEGIETLRKYVETWIKEGIVPEKYVVTFNPTKVEDTRGTIRELALSLRSNMTPKEIHNLVYEVARKRHEDPRELFKKLYIAILGKPYGPRLGKLIYALGIEKVKKTLLSLID